MSNTTPAELHTRPRRSAAPLALAVCLAAATHGAQAQENTHMTPHGSATSSPAGTLTVRQQAVAPIGALAAAGDMAGLNAAINQGLDAGMSVSDIREILVQLYAYAGFPRSLNALGELMTVLDARRQRGIQDPPGRAPGRPIPKGDALLAAGTANQTLLSGGPVQGPLFDFAPVANEYLRSHLFGAIFERDNLDWQSRELATLGMLSALPGAEPQLQAHMRIGMNAGLTTVQLQQLIEVLSAHVHADMAARARGALERHLAGTGGIR